MLRPVEKSCGEKTSEGLNHVSSRMALIKEDRRMKASFKGLLLDNIFRLDYFLQLVISDNLDLRTSGGRLSQ